MTAAAQERLGFRIMKSAYMRWQDLLPDSGNSRAFTLASIVAFFSSIIFLDWVFGDPVHAYGGKWVTVKAETAAGIAICAFSVCALALGWSRAAAVMAGAAISSGLIPLLAYTGHVEINHAFAHKDLEMLTVEPGLMAPTTAVCLALSGISLLMLTAGWSISVWIAIYIDAALCLVSLVAVVGYALSEPVLYKPLEYGTAMAWQTAVLFLAHSFCIFWLAVPRLRFWNDIPRESRP